MLAWGGALAGKLKPNARKTYGWQRATILAAFANALLLLMAMGALTWEAVGRLVSPDSLASAAGLTVMLVAGIGIVVNTATALLFMRGSQNDLNIRGAFLHMAADALVSAGVVVAGGLTLWMGWYWLDPVGSLLIAAVVLLGTWSLFRQSLHLLFDGVPDSIDPLAVRDYLANLPGVSRVHDLHIWAMGTSQVALTTQRTQCGKKKAHERRSMTRALKAARGLGTGSPLWLPELCSNPPLKISNDLIQTSKPLAYSYNFYSYKRNNFAG